MSEPSHIFNWRRLDNRITTSGQPTEDELAQIADLGVRCVINLGLHTHPRALKDERGAVEGLGMTYVHIPVAFDAPTEEDFARFEAALGKAGDHPVHVHCIVNARVSAFFYRLRRGALGEEAARAAMATVWRPGGVWAAFLGEDGADRAHQFAGEDY